MIFIHLPRKLPRYNEMEVKEDIKKTTLITLTTLFITHTIAYFP